MSNNFEQDNVINLKMSMFDRNPAIGSMKYDIEKGKTYIYDGSEWVEFDKFVKTCNSSTICNLGPEWEEITAHPTVQLKIVCEDKKYLPSYANETDACMDLKVKIDFGADEALRCVKDENLQEYGGVFSDTHYSMWIMPNEARTFNTGIKVVIPENYVMMIFPRSSTGFKLNCMLANTTGIIDSGYRDEILVKLYNYGDYPVNIKDGDRVAQFMIIPRPKINLIRVLDNDDDFLKGDRGGGIGSTGK